MQLFIQGLGQAFQPVSMLYILAGVIWGIIGGAIPGILGRKPKKKRRR